MRTLGLAPDRAGQHEAVLLATGGFVDGERLPGFAGAEDGEEGHPFGPDQPGKTVAGSVTEVDVVNGAVCRLGARLGVPTPVNDTLVAAVKGRERAVSARRACETTS